MEYNIDIEYLVTKFGLSHHFKTKGIKFRNIGPYVPQDIYYVGFTNKITINTFAMQVNQDRDTRYSAKFLTQKMGLESIIPEKHLG